MPLRSVFYHSPNTKEVSACVYPYPCSFFSDPVKLCTCAPSTVTKYQKRISGPLLDRIDIHIEVPRVDYEKLSGNRAGEMSETIRARVQAARDIQNKRFSCHGASDIVCNADMRVGGDTAILPVAGRGSEPDAGGHVSTQFVGTRLSSHPQTGAHHRGPGGERGDPLRASGRGVAI